MAVEAATQNGAWDNAYDPPSAMNVPADFKAALDSHPKARHFFNSLSRANRYAFYWQVLTTKKPQTRQAKIAKFIEMLNKGNRLH